MFLKIKKKLLNYTFKIKLIEFFKWKIIDIYRFFRNRPIPHLFGVRCVTGMYGCGKTVAMTKIALDYRLKFGDNIYITTNFGFALQDFPFQYMEQLTEQYDKPILYFWDEVQNEFPSSDKNFPKEVRQALTLNRKGNGKMFYWASQDHELVHKTIRRLTIEYGMVKTFFGRYTRVKWFHALDYQLYFEEKDFSKRLKIHPFKKISFVQSDYLRSLYNSFGYDNGEKLQNSGN